MLHDVSDIVSSEPDRFRERTEDSYESMYTCSFAHVMGMRSNLLQLFDRRYLHAAVMQQKIEEDLKKTFQKLNDSQTEVGN